MSKVKEHFTDKEKKLLEQLNFSWDRGPFHQDRNNYFSGLGFSQLEIKAFDDGNRHFIKEIYSMHGDKKASIRIIKGEITKESFKEALKDITTICEDLHERCQFYKKVEIK